MSGPGPGNLAELLGRAREVQERLARAQRELASRTVEGSAGGGMVRVVATGELRIRSVAIEPQVLAAGDLALVGDLVASAANAALAAAQRMVEQELQRVAGVPPGLLASDGSRGTGS
jgi:hypothetical protein